MKQLKLLLILLQVVIAMYACQTSALTKKATKPTAEKVAVLIPKPPSLAEITVDKKLEDIAKYSKDFVSAYVLSQEKSATGFYGYAIKDSSAYCPKRDTLRKILLTPSKAFSLSNGARKMATFSPQLGLKLTYDRQPPLIVLLDFNCDVAHIINTETNDVIIKDFELSHNKFLIFAKKTLGEKFEERLSNNVGATHTFGENR